MIIKQIAGRNLQCDDNMSLLSSVSIRLVGQWKKLLHSEKNRVDLE